MKKTKIQAWYRRNGTPELVEVSGFEYDEHVVFVSTKLKGNEMLSVDFDVSKFSLVDINTGLAVVVNDSKEELFKEYEEKRKLYSNYRETQEYDQKKKEYEFITKELKLF